MGLLFVDIRPHLGPPPEGEGTLNVTALLSSVRRTILQQPGAPTRRLLQARRSADRRRRPNAPPRAKFAAVPSPWAPSAAGWREPRFRTLRAPASRTSRHGCRRRRAAGSRFPTSAVSTGARR